MRSMTTSNLKLHWAIIMLSAAALVSVTFGVRQVFGLFLVPISIEMGRIWFIILPDGRIICSF